MKKSGKFASLKKKKKLIIVLIFSGILTSLVGLKLCEDNVPTEHNLILNPSFEKSGMEWKWLQWSSGWAPFEISTNRSHQGSHAALLKVSSAEQNRSTVVWGVVQEITIAGRFPTCLEGYYFVEKWSRGAERQYIQVVIIDLTEKVLDGKVNPQIRYILSGLDKLPYILVNAHYVFVDPERKIEPIQGSWVKFSMNPLKDFKENWGYIPSSGHTVRLLFEARFDNRKKDDPNSEAYVYYDDLYFGQSSPTHCK